VNVTQRWTEFERAPVRAIPIGRVLQGTAAYVVGSELLFGGHQVSLGYHKREEKTRSVFVYDVENNDGHHNMYNTGDQARMLPNGEIHYMGRNDDQVKINGQRVELGAVESGVLLCEGVESAAVIVQTVGALKSLVAFVVGRDIENRKLFERAVRNEVTGKVAKHEVPHRVVCIDQMPLSTAGKADRKRLISMLSELQELKYEASVSMLRQTAAQVSTSSSTLVVSTATLVEQCFESVLGKKMDEGASFFEMGGTSLMAMELDAAVQRATHVKGGMGRMLKDGTVAGIVAIVKEED
jgi:hypothetical protein